MAPALRKPSDISHCLWTKPICSSLSDLQLSQHCLPTLLALTWPPLSGWTTSHRTPFTCRHLARRLPLPHRRAPAFQNGQTLPSPQAQLQPPTAGLSPAGVHLYVWLGIRMGKEATSAFLRCLYCSFVPVILPSRHPLRQASQYPNCSSIDKVTFLLQSIKSTNQSIISKKDRKGKERKHIYNKELRTF